MNLIHFRPNLTSNLSLALASFFIAFAIWTIAKEDELTEQKIDVPIRFQAPAYATLRVVPDNIQVTLRYPVSQANLLEANKLNIDLGAQTGDPRLWAGVNEEKLRTIDIDIRSAVQNLPQGFQVVQMQPSSILVYGMLSGREAYVAPRIVGTPAPGYVAGKAETDPITVMLIGTEADLERVPRNNSDQVVVPTDEVDITGRKEYFETRTEILLPDGIQLAEQQLPRVTVIVPIYEQTGQRLITGIPITAQTYAPQLVPQITPTEASVRIEGPLSLIRTVVVTDLVIAPREAVDESLNAQSTVKLDCQFAETVSQVIRENVNIVVESLTPRSAQIKMVKASAQRAKSTPTPKPSPTATPTPAPATTSSATPAATQRVSSTSQAATTKTLSLSPVR